MLDWGFNAFAPFKLFNAGETVGRRACGAARRFYVPLTGDGPVMVMLPRVPENPRLKAEIMYDGPLKPPIKKGDQVATLRVTSQTNAVNEVPLYAAEDVEPGGLMRRGLDSLAHLAFELGAALARLPPACGTDAPRLWRLGRASSCSASSSPSKAEKAPASRRRRGCWPSSCGASASTPSSRASRAARRSPRRCARVILDPDMPPHSALSEALLFYAARADHLDKTHPPGAQRGAVGHLRPLLRFQRASTRARRAACRARSSTCSKDMVVARRCPT